VHIDWRVGGYLMESRLIIGSNGGVTVVWLAQAPRYRVRGLGLLRREGSFTQVALLHSTEHNHHKRAYNSLVTLKSPSQS